MRDIHYTTDGTDNSIILQEKQGNFKSLYLQKITQNLSSLNSIELLVSAHFAIYFVLFEAS
ncbi:MAG TPA: hypothetical protein DCZ00_04690 [Lactococcus sp.]|nr:hypothetical protein [Lactococcus sp.]HBC90725.1 hypothetical protein [Lactococcus sp.]